MVLQINNIIKLKLLNLYIKYIITNISYNVYRYNFKFFFFFYLNYFTVNFNVLSLTNKLYKFTNNLKKLKFFKNEYINSFIFYNLVNNNISNKELTITNISNYDSKYLFIYYFFFIKNIGAGVNKYFTNFYQNNLFFIRFFILKYLKNFIQKKNIFISLQKNHINMLERNIFYTTLIKKTKYLKFLKEINFKIKAFLNLIIISLFSKDVILLKNGIKNILEKLHFKKHRKFLHNLKIIIKSLSYVFFYKFKCLGLYIKIKGKIGLGGSSKKKKFIFKLGSFSFTKKTQKLNYVKDSIRTYSGVLGFEMYLTYK